LLVRAGRLLVRTPLGERLRAPAREVVSAVEHLLLGGATFDPRAYDGDFVISTSDRVTAALLDALDRAIAESAPRAVLRVRTVPVDLAAWLRDSDGVAIGPFAAREGALRVEPLFIDRYVTVFHRRHPLAKGAFTARRFAAADHVLVTPRGESDRGDVDAALEARGLARRVSRVVPSFAFALPLLVRGERVATLPESFVSSRAKPLGLVIRTPPVALPTIGMNIAWHPRHDADPRTQFLRARLHQAVAAAGLPSARG
jgi:DNA-binding transcriptional LysR family regulator